MQSSDSQSAALQGPRVLLQSNAGPYNENSLLGVPSEVHTGETYGQGEKVNVCKFPLGSVNNWNVSDASLQLAVLRGCAPSSAVASPLLRWHNDQRHV